jgi:hypothetical protein
MEFTGSKCSQGLHVLNQGSLFLLGEVSTIEVATIEVAGKSGVIAEIGMSIRLRYIAHESQLCWVVNIITPIERFGSLLGLPE